MQPVFPEVVQNLASPMQPGIGRVVSSERCTHSKKSAGWIRHVAIDVSDTPIAGNFRAGQSFGVLPPGENDRGKPHKLRLYSISSPTAGEDGEGKILSTTVKRLLDENWDDHTLFKGVASNYLCDLQEGDEVRVTGPAGKRFLLPENPADHNYVFFSTGTGIAPFRGMMGDLAKIGMPSQTALISGAPYKSDLLYHQDFTNQAEQWDNFQYLSAVSRQPQDDGAPPMYVQNRVDPEFGGGELAELLKLPNTLIYVCGIAGMELGIFQGLTKVLDDESLAGYLSIDDEIRADPESWNRRMVNRQIKVTKRVMLEVY